MDGGRNRFEAATAAIRAEERFRRESEAERQRGLAEAEQRRQRQRAYQALPVEQAIAEGLDPRLYFDEDGAGIAAEFLTFAAGEQHAGSDTVTALRSEGPDGVHEPAWTGPAYPVPYAGTYLCADGRVRGVLVPGVVDVAPIPEQAVSLERVRQSRTEGIESWQRQIRAFYLTAGDEMGLETPEDTYYDVTGTVVRTFEHPSAADVWKAFAREMVRHGVRCRPLSAMMAELTAPKAAGRHVRDVRPPIPAVRAHRHETHDHMPAPAGIGMPPGDRFWLTEPDGPEDDGEPG